MDTAEYNSHIADPAALLTLRLKIARASGRGELMTFRIPDRTSRAEGSIHSPQPNIYFEDNDNSALLASTDGFAILIV